MQFSRREWLGTCGYVLQAQAAMGTALILRLSDRKIIHVENADFAAGALLPPASTIKPFALLALLEGGRLRPDDEFVCRRQLAIAGHSLNCIHPATAIPMNAARALAYSCNGALAHFALRFRADEWGQALARFGFMSQTGLLNSAEAEGRVARNAVGAASQLQALGEEGIAITPLELLLAYARLCQRLNDAKYGCIREGLEGAVEFGTAQAAQVPGLRVAGKTGSIVLRSGQAAAWFAGFAPSREARVAVVVMTRGRSGGADAAPVAARLLKRYV